MFVKSDNLHCQTFHGLVASMAITVDIFYPLSFCLFSLRSGLNYTSMRDLLASTRGSSPIRERASLSFSAMKSLVLREKEDKLASEFGADEKVLSVINALLNAGTWFGNPAKASSFLFFYFLVISILFLAQAFGCAQFFLPFSLFHLDFHFWCNIGKVLAEGHFTGRTVSGVEAQINATSLLKDIHGAPVESFVVKLSEAVGCLKTLRKMASFWSRVVAEVSGF